MEEAAQLRKKKKRINGVDAPKRRTHSATLKSVSVAATLLLKETTTTTKQKRGWWGKGSRAELEPEAAKDGRERAS